MRVLVWHIGEYTDNWFPEKDYEVLKETEGAYLLKDYQLVGSAFKFNKWITKNGPYKKCEIIK